MEGPNIHAPAAKTETATFHKHDMRLLPRVKKFIFKSPGQATRRQLAWRGENG